MSSPGFFNTPEMLGKCIKRILIRHNNFKITENVPQYE